LSFIEKEKYQNNLTQRYQDIHRDIIENCKQGSVKAQYKLYQLYANAMFNICVRMLNSKEEAEDLLQEAFSEAFYRLGFFRFESSFGAWLKRIVINKCINFLKLKRTEFVLSKDINSFDTVEEEEVDFEEIKLSVERIHKAVEQLADGYRVIFSLYMLEGYDHSEIAEILGISESTSKSQFLRAKKKLKEILEQE